jgi:aspartyl-tRNA(Asn)/glutamyl-tRNA(Gln) amidotransferase subunit B
VQSSGKAPAEIVQAEGLAQVSDEGELRKIAEELVAGNPEQVANFRAGKTALMGWFVGQMMARTKGKADPKTAQRLLVELLQQ